MIRQKGRLAEMLTWCSDQTSLLACSLSGDISEVGSCILPAAAAFLLRPMNLLVGRGKLYACMMRVSDLENILGFLLV